MELVGLNCTDHTLDQVFLCSPNTFCLRCQTENIDNSGCDSKIDSFHSVCKQIGTWMPIQLVPKSRESFLGSCRLPLRMPETTGTDTAKSKHISLHWSRSYNACVKLCRTAFNHWLLWSSKIWAFSHIIRNWSLKYIASPWISVIFIKCASSFVNNTAMTLTGSLIHIRGSSKWFPVTTSIFHKQSTVMVCMNQCVPNTKSPAIMSRHFRSSGRVVVARGVLVVGSGEVVVVIGSEKY